MEGLGVGGGLLLPPHLPPSYSSTHPRNVAAKARFRTSAITCGRCRVRVEGGGCRGRGRVLRRIRRQGSRGGRGGGRVLVLVELRRGRGHGRGVRGGQWHYAAAAQIRRAGRLTGLVQIARLHPET